MANFLKFPQTGPLYLPMSVFSFYFLFLSLPVELIFHLRASSANSEKLTWFPLKSELICLF